MPPSSHGSIFDTSLSEMEDQRPRLSPTNISQFISQSECPRLFEFQASDEFETQHRDNYSYQNTYDPLSPVLAADGIAFEEAVESRLSAGARATHDHTPINTSGNTGWTESRTELSQIIFNYASADDPDGHILITQPYLAPAIGEWPVGGNADALLIWRTDAPNIRTPEHAAGEGQATADTQPHLRFYIIDAKASTEEKTYHQTQVAVYTLLLRQFLSALPWLAPSATNTSESPKSSHPARFQSSDSVTEPVLPEDPSGPLAIPDEIQRPFTWDISGGVITRDVEIDIPNQTDISATPPTAQADAITPTELPSFDLESRELDLRQLLSKSGRFNRLWNGTPDETRYSLTSKCATCRHRRACYTSAVEDGNLAVLGIGAGEQSILEDHEIYTVSDLADLAYPPSDLNPRNDPQPDIKRAHEDTYAALMSDTTLSRSLPRYIIRAQSYLGRVESSAPNTLNGPNPAEIPGSREANLPEDDPPFDPGKHGDGLEFPTGNLIRVYLVPHTDPRFDTLAMVSARITATAAPDEEAQTIAASRPSFPSSEPEAADAEAHLIEDVCSDIATAIEDIGAALDSDGLPLHCYTFSQADRAALEDAFERNRDSAPEAATFADLFQCRAGIDAHVVSEIKPAVESQFALGTPAAGLLQYWELLSADTYSEALATYDLEHVRSDGTDIDLKEAFTYELFSYDAPYSATGEAPTLYPRQNIDKPADSRFPLWPNATNQVPIEYLAAANGHLSPQFIDALEDHYEETPPIKQYLFVDETADQPTQLTSEDILGMAKRLAEALNHVERSITYKEVATEKEPFASDLFNSFELGETNLQRASLEYLQLEDHTAQDELDQHLELPVRGRVATGRSIPVVVESADVDDNGKLVVDAKLAYNPLFENPELVANACRHSGAKEDTMGSWLVANELDAQGNAVGSTSPATLKRGVPITLQTLDINANEATFTALPGYLYQNETEYEFYHDDWTTDQTEADDGTALFERGEVFILDPNPDDITSQRIHDALSTSSNGGFAADFINSLLTDSPATTGEPETPPTTERFPDRGTEAFVNWTAEALEYEPNTAQTDFIRANESQLLALQGPPGTGKTSGALAPALLSRLFAAGVDGESTIGIVVAESNKAIDEVLEEVANMQRTYQSSPLYTDATGDGKIPNGSATTTAADGLSPIEFGVDLIRLVGNPPADDHQEPGVDYLSYYDDVEAEGDVTMADISNRLRDNQTDQHTLSEHGSGTAPVRNADPDDDIEGQATLTGLFGGDSAGGDGEGDGQATGDASETDSLPPSATGTSNRPHTLIFTTPTRLYKLVDNLSSEKSPADWLDEQVGFFDLVAVDEASMAKMPSFLLAGAFARPTAQFLFSGDHRQMPPVQQHDWASESRRTILERAGHLSLLDFVRLLRGELPLDEVNHTDADDLPTSLRDVDYDVPLIQLPTGYRSHEHVTGFLSSNVYEQDDLAYATEETELSGDPSPATDGSAAALDPDIPMTLIVHDDTTSQQSNDTEAAICHTLNEDRHPDEDFGIVTPHNAQRGLLTNAIDDAKVDTVERFQGDEMDMIAVSATAADPQFLHTESDFILNPNRLTVAMSRMKHKLIVIASSSVFTLMPQDVTTYDRAYLWKSLFRACNAANGEPAWSGSLSDFCGQETEQSSLTVPGATSLEVHHYEP